MKRFEDMEVIELSTLGYIKEFIGFSKGLCFHKTHNSKNNVSKYLFMFIDFEKPFWIPKKVWHDTTHDKRKQIGKIWGWLFFYIGYMYETDEDGE